MIGKSSSIAMWNSPGPMVWNHPWFHIGQASNHRMKVTRGSTFFGIDAICAVYLSKRDELTNHRQTPVGFDYRPWSLRSPWSTNVCHVYHVYHVSPVFWEAIFALTYAPVQKWCILEVSTVSNVCAMALSAPKEQSGASTACVADVKLRS